ncbi:MAG TPA: DUF4410 domain-containing protein [Acidobacteriaceae bacterium]
MDKRVSFLRLIRPLCAPSLWVVAAVLLPHGAHASGPLAAKINVTPGASYDGANPLPKPSKIVVYDFAVNTADVQADKVQSLRPRHLITGDEKPEAIAAGANKTFSKELSKALARTGIPVEHAQVGAPPPANALLVQGSFVSLKQGVKAERVTVGMGAGSADVQSTVDVHLNTPGNLVLVTQFRTDTNPAKNVGGGVGVAAGLNPAAVAAKSTISDRKKTLDSYASKTADATAKEITKVMAKQGWINTNDKGEVVHQ